MSVEQNRESVRTTAGGSVWTRSLGAVVSDARVLAAALWLGAAVFFSAAVAPSAFAALPARELAGAVVARTLSVVNTGGFCAALFLLVTLPLDRAASSRRARTFEAAALAVVAAACAAGQWLISARLAALRAQMSGPIDNLPASDPLRVAFNALHVYSVWALTAAMLAGVVALLLIVRRRRSDKR